MLNEEDEESLTSIIYRNGLFAGQNYEKLHQKCCQENVLFVDPFFPPSNFSIFPTVNLNLEGLEWRRASELASEEPTMFIEGATRFDINQGILGDCWLLAAICNLTFHSKLFEFVVPKNQSFVNNYAGIFHFRFWQYGTWIDIVVDDFLPCIDGKLIYLKSDNPNEFWSALMEKAYAKLHGSYHALQGGSCSEAMVDFSGGCSEHYSLDESKTDLMNVLLKAMRHQTMISCSIKPDPRVPEAKTSSGLVRGHAYSITGAVKVKINTGRVKGLIPIIRFYNPWGNEFEWKGTWADGNPEWKFIDKEDRNQLNLKFEKDGEFYMSFQDFLLEFDSLEICNMAEDHVASTADQAHLKWSIASFDGKWNCQNGTAGGCRNFMPQFASNPQYLMHLRDSDVDADRECTCIISLMQKVSRRARFSIEPIQKEEQADDDDRDVLTIGYIIYEVRGRGYDYAHAGRKLDADFFMRNQSKERSPNFINLREISGRFTLPPGSYVIIPSTYSPNVDGEFLLRVFSEKPCDLTSLS